MHFAPLLAPLLAPAADPAPKTLDWTVGDKKREAIVYLPANADKPAPAIFAFHGHGGTAAHAAKTFGLAGRWYKLIPLSGSLEYANDDRQRGWVRGETVASLPEWGRISL